VCACVCVCACACLRYGQAHLFFYERTWWSSAGMQCQSREERRRGEKERRRGGRYQVLLKTDIAFISRRPPLFTAENNTLQFSKPPARPTTSPHSEARAQITRCPPPPESEWTEGVHLGSVRAHSQPIGQGGGQKFTGVSSEVMANVFADIPGQHGGILARLQRGAHQPFHTWPVRLCHGGE